MTMVLVCAGRMMCFFNSSQSNHKPSAPFVTCQQSRDQNHKFVNSHDWAYGGLHK